jgi:hypothetical protein
VADWQNIKLCLKVTVCWLGCSAGSVGRDAGSNWMYCPVTELEEEVKKCEEEG